MKQRLIDLLEEAPGGEEVLRVKGRFETAHEGNVGTRRTPDVYAAFESSRAPGERCGGVFGNAEREDARGGFGETADRGGVVSIGKESKVKHSARSGEDCMRERRLVGQGPQLLEKWSEACGKSRNFENGCGRRSFEKNRNRLAEIVPEVGGLGLVESYELRGLRCGRSGELGEFAGSAVADFGDAFYADAEVPGICREFSLQWRGRRLRGIFTGFEEELHELSADKIAGGRAD